MMRSAILATALIPSTLMDQPLKRLVGSDDLVPGTQGYFAHFQNLSNRDGQVAFSSWNLGNPGIYIAGPGGVEVVADSLRPLAQMSISPDDQGALDSDGSLVFRAQTHSGVSHLMRFHNGAISSIIDGTAAMPGTGGQFRSFGNPLAEAGRIVFDGKQQDGIRLGVYELSGPNQASRIVDNTMNVPGTHSRFVSFNGNTSGSLRGDRLAFTARFYDQGYETGVFMEERGSIISVVQSGHAAPGGEVFTGFSRPIATQGGVGYIGHSSIGAGLYLSADGHTSTVATRDMYPGLWLFGFAADADGLLFQTSGVAASELFYWTQDAGAIRLIGAGDVFDGRVVTAIGHSPNSLWEGTAAIVVEFGPGDSAIYLIDVPAPGTLTLLAWVGIALRRRR